MAKSKEVGRIQFTCTLPLRCGLKVYDLAEKLDVGANKVLQILAAYAVDRAYIGHTSEDIETILFKEVTE